MKEKEVKEMLKMNLQFFADDNPESGKEGEGEGQQQSNTPPPPPTTTFTQEEVVALIKQRESEASKKALSDLGLGTAEEAKQAVELYKAFLQSQKSDGEKDKEAMQQLSKEKDEAVAKAQAAEEKYACVVAGVKKDCVDDVLAIARVKVTSEKNVEKVLSELKQDNKYSAFFDDGSGGDNTGNEPGHNGGANGGNKKGSLGRMLAQRHNGAAGKKNKTN